MTSPVSADHRGVVKRSKRPEGPVSPARPSYEGLRTIGSEAYRLAIANKHKGWAKRWLKEHGHWL